MTHKRKHNDVIEEDNVDSNDMWCKNLIANLSKCQEAISLQTHVLKLIFEHALVTAKKQCIFKLEHEMAKHWLDLNSQMDVFSALYLNLILRIESTFK